MGGDNLDALSAAGLPVFDLNNEFLDRTDWSKSLLGPRESWPPSLACVANLVISFPHAAALWWGNDLCCVHNLAWAKATGQVDGQGSRAHDTYSGEALNTLESAARGRTVKVACKWFLQDFPSYDDESTILLSTILDEQGQRQGVLGQLFHNPTVEKYLPDEVLDKYSKETGPGRQLKAYGTQQPPEKDQHQDDQKQTELFQRFAEILPTGLAILDSDAEAVFVNDGFFKLTTNRTAKEFRAWPESIDRRDYNRVMNAYREAFSSRKELRVEFRCSSPDTEDTDQWRLFLLRPLSQDPEAGFICAVVDITEIKRAELAQEKAATEAQERKEQQERFIDMVSHEIRNPLSAVLHLAEEVKEVARDIEKNHPGAKEQIAEILDAADTVLLCVSHQNTLVDDILSFSKLDSMMLSLAPRQVQPKWDFSKALKVFHSEFKAKKIQFHYSMDVTYDRQGVDYVIADINRMKQVLVNLVTNAIKFTAKKHGDRNISVSMGASEERPTSYPPNVVFFQTTEENFHVDSTMTAEWGNSPSLYLMVAIKDTGIGISRKGQSELFERFRQVTPKTQESYGGSGLGLFISRKLCQLHGGDIGVSSIEGEGSTFAFFFRVRRSDGSSVNGRPPFGQSLSRSSSTGSNPAMAGARSPRPSYSRANSAYASNRQMKGISEETERPRLGSEISNSKGIDTEDTAKTLKDPPTEYHEEHHPNTAKSARYRETEKAAEAVEQENPSLSADAKKIQPELERSGETNRQEAGAEAESGKRKENEAEAQKRTLLLVEDNLINQKVLRRQLQSRGFEVFVANNGQEAIDAVKARGESAASPDEKNDRPYFDCILMDQEMPIKDGNAATMEIRDLQMAGLAGHSPILGVSANVREAQTKSMLDAGMDEVIRKPFKVDDLAKRIRGIIPKDGGE